MGRLKLPFNEKEVMAALEKMNEGMVSITGLDPTDAETDNPECKLMHLKMFYKSCIISF